MHTPTRPAGVRAVRALGALLALALLLFGVPWVLLTLGSVDHLLQIDPTSILTARADSDLILALLSAVGWVAWLLVAVTTILEVVTVVSRQRIRITLPGTGWLRPAIGALVVAAVLVPTAASADPGPPPRTISAPAEPEAVATVTSPGESSTPSRSYLVREGDELWNIAQRELGNGERWREIVALNPSMSDTYKLSAGQQLALPVHPITPAVDETAFVVVERGDSLWSIAERVLGDGSRWPEIHELNRAQVADPNLIDVGWALRLPDAPAPSADPADSPVEGEAPPREVADSPADVPGAARPAERAMPTPTPPTEIMAGMPAPAPAPEPPQHAGEAATETDPLSVLGPIGAVLALGVVAGVATRRRAQLLGRAVGRRLVPVAPRVARFWVALAHRADAAPDPDLTPTPTTVLLGWAGDGSEVRIDLEGERTTVLTGSEAPAGLAAILTGLSSAPWSETVEVVVVGGAEWADALDDPRITALDSAQDGLAALTRTCSGRRLGMQGRTLRDLRADPDCASSWPPVVFIFEDPLSATRFDVVADALALGEVGVSVVATASAPPHITHAAVDLESTVGTLRGVRFTPQLVGEPARRVLVDLFRATGSTETEPAPWWREGSELPSNVLPLPRVEPNDEELPMPEPPADPLHPTLLLLGEVELSSAAGPTPNRALAQCMEYCAWLLVHPGATSTVMVRDLLVAETTRRSNMSRLRSWLGTAPDGLPYLPDAYTGRIRLDERVTSDWERFESLLAGGVNAASSAALRQALRLVRGEPLGTLAFQWHWAQTLRADMVAMIVDAASVLADRAIEHDDPDLALWAIGRGRLAAPDDDKLSVRAIHAHAVAGRTGEMERAVVALNRSTRTAGRDLPPELARRVQFAIHLDSTESPRPASART